MKKTMMKETMKKQKSRILATISAVAIVVGAIGAVAANERSPYDAPELRIVKGAENYDLLEGITYDAEQYQLAVVDTGSFDIHVPGKYTVSYRLTSLTQSTEEGKMPVESQTAAPDISSGDAAQTPSADSTQTPSADPAQTSSPNTAPIPSGTPDSIGFTRYVVVQEPGAQIRNEQDPLQLYPETALYEAVSGREAEQQADGTISSEIQFKDSTLLTADAYVLDKSVEKVKDAAVTVKDDAELRAACTVVKTTVGGTETKVCRMEPGTYSITLASTDPDTGEEITAERTVEILPPEKMDYDLTQDVTVLKSEMSPQGGDATNLPALQIAQALLHNGYKVSAGVKQAAAPAEGELFAQADGFVLDPTDFTVNANGMDGAWSNDGTWFMANADGDNTRIVFRKDALIAKTPVQVTHNGVTQQFTSYEKALAYIDTQTDTAYTVTNLRPMDFTAEDLAQLKAMKKTGRSIVFTGAATGAGAVTYGECYHVRFREPLVELPAGYDITWDQPVKYDQGGREAADQEITVEFIKNGGVLRFAEKFMTADVRRESAEHPGTYGDVERLATVYGGSAAGTCDQPVNISIQAGRFAAVYGGNKTGSHTGNVQIHIDSEAVGADALYIRRLDGASAGEKKKPGNRTADIDSKGVHTIQNLYNYDTLTLINGTLTIPEGQQAGAANLDSCLAADYAGVTTLQDESTLQLLNRNGTRRMGSLIRPTDAVAEKTPSLILARAVTANGYDPMDKRNPYLVQLTAQDPFNIDGGKTQNKIYVSYSNNDEKAAGDIIFSLVGVEDTAQQREKYVSTKQLENTGFDPMKMVADVTERTIKLDSVTMLEDAKQPVTIATSTKEAAGDIIELWQKTDADTDFVKVNAYSSYAKALRAIGAGDLATTYKLVNLVLAEFTEEDQKELLENRQAKELIFEGAPNMMQFKNLKCITLPAARGYGITFNQPVAAMAQNNTKDSFEFYNNGGALTFGEKFRSQNSGDSRWDMIVYGGAEAGECTGNAVIRISAGQFRAVYGGNKAGTYTGDVDITINCPADRIQANGNNLRITRLDGATAEKSNPLETEMIQKAGANQAHNWQPGQNQRENGNQKVSITIQNTPVPGKTGILQICKLYNYDELNIGSGTLKIPYIGNNDYNLVSSLVGGYVGKTVIFDDAELRLENTYGFKSMGSLVRQTSADVTKQAKLYFNYARDYAGLNYKNNQHPFLIRLTDEDPFGIDHGMPERKIRVYGEREDAELIVFNLTGVKQEKYVTVKGVKSGFTWYNFYPKYEDHTIRMEDAYTMVTDPAGNRTKYRDIAGAITAVADMEKARKEQRQQDWAGNKYMISFFRDEYVMNWKDTVTQERRAHADEVEAMKYAGKGGGAFTYLGEEYTDLPETLKDAVITWDAKRNEAGDVTKEYIEIYVAGDLNFFGTSTTLDGLSLNYSGHGNMDPITSRDIYANGSDLTITRDSSIININYDVDGDYTKQYPSFYGGTGKTVETNTKKGGNITILPAEGVINFYDLKDFTNLTVGDGNDEYMMTGSVTVYGQLNDKLTTGKNETTGGNGGTLYFNSGYISLLGYQKCYVTNVRVSDNTGNYLFLSRDNEKTYPLQVAEKLTLDNADVETDNTLINKRLMIQTSKFPAHGDVALEFTKEEDAKERQYQDAYNGYNNIVLKKYRRFILFGDITKTFEQIYLYKTAEGEALDDNKNLIGKYRTYAEAFEEVGTEDAYKIYTFKNVVPVDFTQDDQDELLQAVSRDKAAGLILESGYRGDGNTDGAAGTRYRVRMRIQTLQLPAGVDVTFRDIVMEYDQGRNSELTKEADGNTVNVQDMVFAGNGGALTFGNGVVFLQHKDAPMYPTVYGGSIKGALNMGAAVTIQSGTYASVYGAGTAAQTGDVSVQMSGGSVENLFGGGRTAAGKLTGSTQVTVSGGAIRGRNIYGGGDGAEVTGNTKIEITAPLVTTEQERQSVYGGGKDAIVRGNTAIDMTLPNQMANANIYFDTISGYGTESVTGPDQKVTVKLADNVEGDVKSISIKTQDKTKQGDASVKKLSGFTELSIGHEEEVTGNFNYSHVTVTERFDSRPVGDSADLTVKDRTDTVKLNYSGLILKGDYQGHIGSLKTKGETVIYIYKTKADTNDTRPLILDGTVTLTTPDSIKLRSIITNNTYEDKMLVFTTEANADLTQKVGDTIVTKYKDGEKNLNVSNLAENNLGYIIFQTPPAHTVESYVTYAPADQVILDGSQTDDGRAQNPKKVFHFEYSRQNKHPVDKAYVIAMPKDVATQAGKDSATADAKTAAERYTKMDTGYATNGTFSDPGFYKTSGNDQNVWTVTWTKDPNKDNYAGGTTGDNNPITVDEKNYWYILHVVCEKGEYYSTLVDVNAPEKDRKEVETSFDSATGKYTFTLYVADHSETNSAVRPFDNRGKGRLSYNAAGVAYAYWALGQQKVANYNHQEADNAAAKANLVEKVETLVEVGKVGDDGNPVIGPDGNQVMEMVKQDTAKIENGKLVYKEQVATDEANGPVRGAATVEYAGTGTVKVNPPGVVGGNVAKITVEVDKTLIDAAIKDADQTVTNVIWVYAKDHDNNTSKIAIPINDNLIDVTVPLKVGVVAVKSADGQEELLAPNCFIKNNGAKKVKAAINGFATNAGQTVQLSLVDQDTGDIAGNKLSLYLKQLEITKDDQGTPWNTFNNINVLKLRDTPLELGTLAPAGNTAQEDYLGFTFGAHYNAAEIVYPDDADREKEIVNTMTYHFVLENN